MTTWGPVITPSSAGFESDGNAVPVLFLYNGVVVSVVFFCILQFLTVIFHDTSVVINGEYGCNFTAVFSIVRL